MRAEGLEPPSLAAPAPKAGVSTNFTTPAAAGLILVTPCRRRTTIATARPRMRSRLAQTIAGGTGPTARMAVSKTAGRGSIPRSPAPSDGTSTAPPAAGGRGGAVETHVQLGCDAFIAIRFLPPARGARSALWRLDQDQLPPVQHLRDGAGLLDLRVRVANRVMQGLDVHPWDLHGPLIPRSGVRLPSIPANRTRGRAAGIIGSVRAGEVLWLHRSLPSF